MLAESGHDAGQFAPLSAEDEGARPAKDAKADVDLHAILSTLLQSYKDLEETGMVWDYKYKGQLYKGVEMVFLSSLSNVMGMKGTSLPCIIAADRRMCSVCADTVAAHRLACRTKRTR